MTYKDKYRLLTDALKQKAKEIMPPGSRLVLFGSRARGDFNDDSDWDVHIILPASRRLSLDEIDNVAYPLEEIGYRFNEFISASVYSSRDWELLQNHPFYQNVEKDKIVLL